MRDDYDRKVGIHARYMVKQLGDNIKKIVQDEGVKYFDCDIYEKTHCAKDERNDRTWRRTGGTRGGLKYDYHPVREDCPPTLESE
ncbi:hypothetical protein C1H76_1919 [Elsinoe australis]|uniref:Uncharacterized protein n=1 Tax=Elsinoe australis TaxID=40998 RepID=A0A4U7B3B6_9PEZI|nr:hypothetical protein C1H76_1919 [Elsinoe australis]